MPAGCSHNQWAAAPLVAWSFTPNWFPKTEKQYKTREFRAMFSKQALLAHSPFIKLQQTMHGGSTNKNADTAGSDSLARQSPGSSCFETLPARLHENSGSTWPSIQSSPRREHPEENFPYKNLSQCLSVKKSKPWGVPWSQKMNPS